ncbi:MAG: SpoIIE family protein phosphatase [Bacteroidetes bacterium]|nr:SpoIIE family protein phosphatase [Bacteroidota bacterium]HET6244757.1 two-component regulator propeller domain-containing protein [Bacteroidia bacterium]
MNLIKGSLRFLAILVFVLIFHVFSFSQILRKQVLIKGMKNVKANCFFQDKQGYLWTGTSKGLIQHYSTGTTSFTTENGLVSEEISALSQGADGTIWIGHNNGKISILDSSGIKAFEHNAKLSDNPITAILHKNAKTYITTYGSGVFILNNNTLNLLNEDEGLGDNYVYSVASDNSSRVFFGCDAGITIYDENKADAPSFNYLSMRTGLPDNIVREMVYFKDQLWIGMQDSGFCKYSLIDQKFVRSSTSLNWNFGPVTSLKIDYKENLWIGTQTGNLLCFSGSDFQHEIIKSILPMQGLFPKNILCLFEDAEKNFWIGTESYLIHYKKSRFEFIATDEIKENVFAIYQDKKGRHWVGSDSGFSMYHYDKTGKLQKKKYFSDAGKIQIVSIVEENENILWLGTYGKGIIRLNVLNGTSDFYTVKEGLANDNVISLVKDNAGTLWAGTLGGGISEIKQVDTKLVFTTYNTENGLNSNYIYQLFIDASNQIWIASDGGGLCFKKTGQKIESLLFKELKNATVYSVTEDKEKNIWFSTDDGVYKYDKSKLELFDINNGLREKTPVILTCNLRGNIVTVHNSGIDVLDKTEVSYYNLFENEQDIEFEPNINSFYTDKEGNIWIGTNSGIVKFRSVTTQVDLLAPRIHLINIKVNLKEHLIKQNTELDHNNNNLIFTFQGLWFSSPEKIKYRYKLEGFENDWSFETETPHASYPNLPPGKYTFKVQATSENYIWSDELNYSFTILPPFWKTWWFISALIIAIISAVMTFIQYRERKLVQEKRLLEDKVEERTSEITKQKKIIEIKNSDITSSIAYAKRIQQAMLVNEGMIKNYIPESFVLFKPKDIVSGDFYWFSCIENEAEESDRTILLAAADCTGHGVPGAFMSMIGINKLNEVVKEVTDPGRILEKLNVSIKSSLQKSGNQVSASDGMDIAICSLNVKKRELFYSGANRPLWVIRKNENKLQGTDEEFEFIEYKADKVAIGGYTDNSQKFVTQSIELKKGDGVYLFSDGFADQFGGDSSKKLMTKNFRKFLFTIQHKSLKEQSEELSEFFEIWKGENEQIDDVLVIGFRA